MIRRSSPRFVLYARLLAAIALSAPCALSGETNSPVDYTQALSEPADTPPNEENESAERFAHLDEQPTNRESTQELADGEESSYKSSVAYWSPLEILGSAVKPNERKTLPWTAGQSFDGSQIETPVTVIRGANAGPTLCLTAAVHGDELNGVEIVRRVMAGIDPEELSGSLIGVPIVNMLGFARGSRYLPDRRDLNRYFPGQPNGSFASRIAHLFFSNIIKHCDALVDFHTGSFKRTNLPQLRADLSVPAIMAFIEHFGATAVLNKVAAPGTLRGAATAAGIPTVAFELGEPVTLQLRNVEFGVKAVDTLLDKLGMVERFRLWSEPQPVFYRSRWVRAYHGGMLTSTVNVGKSVLKDDVLGLVTNPLTNEVSVIHSPFDGRLLGRALNQFVLPGFAIFHIGIEASGSAHEVPDEADEDMELRSADGEDGDLVLDEFPDDNEAH